MKSELNRLIDMVMKPFERKYGCLAIIADGALHALVEGNPRESLEKFTRYNLPKIVRELVRKVG